MRNVILQSTAALYLGSHSILYRKRWYGYQVSDLKKTQSLKNPKAVRNDIPFLFVEIDNKVDFLYSLIEGIDDVFMYQYWLTQFLGIICSQARTYI